MRCLEKRRYLITVFAQIKHKQNNQNIDTVLNNYNLNAVVRKVIN